MKKFLFFVIIILFFFSYNCLAKELFKIGNFICDESYIQAFQKNLPSNFRTTKEELCKAFLRMYLVKQESEKNGILKDKMVQKQLEIASLQQLYRIYMKDIVNKTKITEDVLKSYYISHKKEFSSPRLYVIKTLKFNKLPGKLKLDLNYLKTKTKEITTEKIAEKDLVILFGKRNTNDIVNLKNGKCIILHKSNSKEAICKEKVVEPKFLPFEKVRERIKKRLLDLKGGWIVEKELKRLINKYKPEIKEQGCQIKE